MAIAAMPTMSCDVAHLVPCDGGEKRREELYVRHYNSGKPVLISRIQPYSTENIGHCQAIVISEDLSGIEWDEEKWRSVIGRRKKREKGEEGEERTIVEEEEN
jgi:hypothetical protein